ncbi:MAG: hypothetical protein LBC82_02625 [Oscillospiraceae bacterium]|nr:hypothetical protein [Oscillospiraceae bacterium]
MKKGLYENMIKEIRKCEKELERLLGENSPDTGWDSEAKNLLIKIKFFQHERLIHLIVTMTMSLLTIITAFALLTAGEAVLIPLMLLFAMLLALTAAYLSHYFKLENGVQKLYRYYFKLQEKSKNG